MIMKIKDWQWIVGISLVVLICVAVVFARRGYGHRNHHGRGRSSHEGKRHFGGNLVSAKRIYRVTNADSVLRKKMKPAVDHAIARLKAIRKAYDSDQARVLDSIASELKPLLSEQQFDDLSDWKERQNKRNN
jgi:hypothetical protein